MGTVVTRPPPWIWVFSAKKPDIVSKVPFLTSFKKVSTKKNWLRKMVNLACRNAKCTNTVESQGNKFLRLVLRLWTSVWWPFWKQRVVRSIKFCRFLQTFDQAVFEFLWTSIINLLVTWNFFGRVLLAIRAHIQPENFRKNGCVVTEKHASSKLLNSSVCRYAKYSEFIWSKVHPQTP
jgi:hypothetical protein